MDHFVLRCRGLLRSCGASLVLWLALCEAASATAFFINQQSVRGLGRVDAGNTAAADELGTIFFNPAGLIQFWKDSSGTDFRGSFGTHLIIPRSEIRNAGSTAASPATLGNFVAYDGGNTKNPTDPTPVPNVYLAKRLADGRAAIGVGINVPFGLETSSNGDWFGRYDAVEASLRTVNMSVVGAYRLDPRLSIGGGIDLQYANTRLVTAIPNPLALGGPSAATDGRVETSGHTWTPGFNVGLLYTSEDERTRVGVHYRSGMTHDIKGSTTITGLTGPLAAFNGVVGARADLKLPAIATIGIWHNVDPLVLLAEFAWYDWSTFKEIRTRFDDGRPDAVRPTNYRDAYGVSIGAEYPLRDSLTARGGIHYDTTPTVDAFRDTTVPDSQRIWLGLGATYRWSPKVNLDFAFNHVFFRHTDIGITRTFFDDTPLATAVRINGSVKSVVNTISIDFRCAF